jgi:hypothetical protein
MVLILLPLFCLGFVSHRREELRGLTVFIILMDYRAATLTGRRRRGRSGRQSRCTGWALLDQVRNRWSQTRQVFQQVEPEWGAEREQTGCNEDTEQVRPELAKPGIKPARPLWIIPARYETRWHQRKTSFFNVIL